MTFKIFVCGEKDPDWVSRKIMKKLGTDYSHIGMFVTVDVFEIIYHSVGKGFSKIDDIEHYEEMKTFLKEHNFQEIDITKYIKNEQFALGYLEGRLGAEYSESQYLGFIFGFMRRFVKNGRAKGICSEEAARFLVNCCNHELKFDRSKFDFVSPKDVWEKVNEIVKRG